MIRLILLLSTILVVSPVYSLVTDTTIVYGKVKAFDSEKVTVIDQFGQKHRVERKKIIPQKFTQGSYVSFAVKLDVSKLSKMDFQIKNFNKYPRDAKLRAYNAIVEFLKRLDKQTSKNLFKSTQNEAPSFEMVFDLIFPRLHADSTHNCMYGGWPSLLDGRGRCRAPWNVSSSGYQSCGGGSGVYRCNPDLFGPGRAPSDDQQNLSNLGAASSDTDVEILAHENTAGGMCIRSSTSNLTENCLKAGRHNLSQVIDSMTDEKFNNLMDIFARFCNSSPQGRDRTRTCIALDRRISEIRYSQLEGRRTCRILRMENEPLGGDEGSCISVAVTCRQGDRAYSGYLGRQHSRDLAQLIGVDGNYQVSSTDTEPLIGAAVGLDEDEQLYREPCGQGEGLPNNPDQAFMQQCTSVENISDIGLSLGSNAGSSTAISGSTHANCRSDVSICTATVNCLAAPEDSDNVMNYNLTMVCPCDILQYPDVTQSTRIAACRFNPIPQLTPNNNYGTDEVSFPSSSDDI